MNPTEHFFFSLPGIIYSNCSEQRSNLNTEWTPNLDLPLFLFLSFFQSKSGENMGQQKKFMYLAISWQIKGGRACFHLGYRALWQWYPPRVYTSLKFIWSEYFLQIWSDCSPWQETSLCVILITRTPTGNIYDGCDIELLHCLTPFYERTSHFRWNQESDGGWGGGGGLEVTWNDGHAW